jgi:hypothetical protein
MIWKISTSTGPKRHVVIHQSGQGETEHFLEALSLLFARPATQNHVDAAYIQFYDDKGDLWAVESGAQALRVSKNKQEIAGDYTAKLQLVQTAFDPTFIQGETDSVVSLWRLSREKGQFVARSVPPGQDQIKFPAEMLKKFEANVQFLRDAGALGLLRHDNLPQWIRKLEQYYYGWLDLSKQKESILAEMGEQKPVEPDNRETLKAQLSLIDEIEKVASPLLDPKTSLTVVKEKLTRIEEELGGFMKKNNIDPQILGVPNLPWEEVLSVLTQARAYEKFEGHLTNVHNILTEKICPVLKTRFEVVEDLLQYDNQITTELENCLLAITKTYQESLSAQQEGPQGLWGKVKKSLKTEDSLQVTPEQATQILEKSRMAVDYSLARLGELHSQSKEFRDLPVELLDECRATKEKYTSKVEKYRATWHEFASRYHIPADITIRNLLGLIGHLGHYSRLWNQREELRALHNQHRERLVTLEQLVREWRGHTGSQKDTSLAEPSILLSEARGILQFKDKKQTHLDKIQAVAQTKSTQLKIVNHIDRRMAELEMHWDAQLKQFGLNKPQIRHADIPKFLAELVSAAGLAPYLDPELMGKETSQPLSSEIYKLPLTLLSAEDLDLDTNARLRLLGLLAKTPDHGVCILVTDDDKIRDLAEKMDFSTTSLLQAKAQAEAAPTPTPKSIKKDRTEPLVSDRAKRALEIFQKPRT